MSAGASLTLKDMKSVELAITREIYNVCHAEGLTCLLYAGTLLGAVRHHGFIPWDDDVDLVMPRPDYERFVDAFSRRTSKPYLKPTWYRNRSSIYPFIKIVDTRTEVIEHYVDERWSHTGVWVDVFPLDGIGENDAPFEECLRLRKKYDYLTANVHEGSSAAARIAKRVLKAVMPKEDIFDVARQLDDIARATPIENSTDVAQLVGTLGPCERMPRSLLETTTLEFEGEHFDAPRDYDAYLTRLYGDYMTPPPESERIPHNVDAHWIQEPDPKG